ncbi:hypothetical protein QOZ80_3BG0260950 [Eleusine coracana subsp. coracana]|nr:hypothetical protein QOZ80_3BG0260950 [Eleusine coracana subsp. coracana]
MAKRRPDEHDGGGRASKRPRRQHLYLVLDDWSYGYSIRQIDLSSGQDSTDDGVATDATIDRTAQRLPPAIFRLEAPHAFPEYFTAAFGTKIMALHPWDPEMEEPDDDHPVVPRRLFPALDVRTRAISFYPRPKGNLADPVYIPVVNGVLALSSRSSQLLPVVAADDGPGGQIFPCRRSWRKLSRPPFKSRHVTSYAVHPDGRTVFVSTNKQRRSVAATFSVDTACAEWKRRGDWTLPFAGRAHFDRDLDAWVGLSGDPGTVGYVCAMDEASTNPDDDDAGDGQRLCPSRKLSQERLFGGDAAERQVGATLVYLGGGSRFCLVQCVSFCVDDEEEEELGMERTQLYLFRLTTFSLRYDKNGDLTTGNSRRARYYDVPYAATESGLRDIVAFWM